MLALTGMLYSRFLHFALNLTSSCVPALPRSCQHSFQTCLYHGRQAHEAESPRSSPNAARLHSAPRVIQLACSDRAQKKPRAVPYLWLAIRSSTFGICSIYPENTDDLLEMVSLLFVIVFCIFIPEMSRHAHTHSHRNRLQAAEKPSPQIIPQVYGLFAIHLLSDQFLLILLPPTGEKCSTRQDHFCLYLAAVFFVCMFQGLTFSCYTELQ